MTKLVKYSLISLGAAGAGAGVTAGVAVPLALKAKNGVDRLLTGMEKFVGKGYDDSLSWSKPGKKLNLVALGDSETAGFNALTTKLEKTFDLNGDHKVDTLLNGDEKTVTERDYLSYADFLANDLHKANKLNSYYNYAISGGRVHDQWQRVLENQLELEKIKKADLITMTIGANDLLAYANLLKIPFTLSMDGIMQLLSGDSSSVNDKVRKLLFKDLNEDAEVNTEAHGRTDRLIKESISLLNDMVNNGKSFSYLIGMKEEFISKVFDSIKRNIIIMMRDIHAIAPQARVVLLGYAFPFAQFGDAVNFKRPELGNLSIKDIFDKLLASIKEAASYAIGGSHAFGEYISIDTMKIYKSSDPSRDGENKIFTDYVKHDDVDSINGGKIEDFWIQNAMPNAGDIHPSTFGHELIGNSLFSHLAYRFGIKNPVDLYTYSTPFVDDNIVDFEKFERIDENPKASHMLADTLLAWMRKNGTEDDKDRATLASEGLRLILPDLTKIDTFMPLVDVLQDESVMAVFKDIFSALKFDGLENIGNVITNLKTKLNDSKNQATLDFINAKLTELFTSQQDAELIKYAKGLNGILNIFRTSKASSYAQNIQDVQQFALLLNNRFASSNSMMLPYLANFLYWLTSEREATNGIKTYVVEREHNAATFIKTRIQTSQQALFDTLDHLGEIFKTKTAMSEIVISNIMRALTTKEQTSRKAHEKEVITKFQSLIGEIMSGGPTTEKIKAINDLASEYNKLNNYTKTIDFSDENKANAEMKIWRDTAVLSEDLQVNMKAKTTLASSHQTIDQYIDKIQALFVTQFKKFNAMINGEHAPAFNDAAKIAVLNYFMSDGFTGIFSDTFLVLFMPIVSVFTEAPSKFIMTVYEK